MALALSLRAAGIEVDVYESTSTVNELGVGINVLPHAARELTELGLLDDLYAIGIPTEIVEQRAPDGLTNLDDIVSRQELEEICRAYKHRRLRSRDAQ